MQPDGTGHIEKHYRPGHISHELVQVMPDERTVLMGNESTGLHAVDGVGSFHCIMSNFEHAGDCEKSLHDKLKDTLASFVRAFYNDRYAGAVGYLAITQSARAHSGNQW